MQILSAKGFSERTCLPLRAVTDLCRDGTIPCLKRGRTYLIDAEIAEEALRNAMKYHKSQALKMIKKL